MNKHERSIVINQHVFSVFERYLTTSIEELLETIAMKYGKTYDFTFEDLKEEFLPDTTIVVAAAIASDKKNKSKLKKRKEVTPKRKIQQCIARTWSNGKGNQCSRKACNQSFCKTHQNQIDRKGFLWQGTINDDDNKVAIVYQEKMKRIQKHKKCPV